MLSYERRLSSCGFTKSQPPIASWTLERYERSFAMGFLNIVPLLFLETPESG